MKIKLIILFLLSFAFAGKAQCWSDKIYRINDVSSYLIKTDGTLCRLNTGNQVYSLIQLGSDTNWSSYEGGNLFLKNDGSVWLLNISTQVFSQVNIGNGWKSISILNDVITGMKTNNTIWKWSNSSIDSTPIQIGTDSDWVSFNNYGGFYLAKKTNGTLWSWGVSNYGELGLGNNSNVINPTQIGNSTWLKYIKGYYSIIAIKTDGTLWSWGNNGNGQLGTGGNVSSNIPLQIGVDSNWKDIKQGGTHAIKTDGTLWGWGSNFYYSLGISSTVFNVLTPTQVGSDNDWDNFNYNLTQKMDGSFWGWGGFNSYGTISETNYPDYYQPREIIGGGNFQTIKINRFSDPFLPNANSFFNILALDNNNSLFVWGQFGLYQGSFSIGYLNRFQIGCEATLNTNKISKKEISVFPNPVTDILNIQIEDQLNNAEIFDLGGRLLHTEKIINNQLNMSQLQRGIYFVKINGTDKVYSIKISKE